MASFDADIGWASTQAMVLCTCKHYFRSHRPISRKCSICACEHFTDQHSAKEPPPVPVSQPS